MFGFLATAVAKLASLSIATQAAAGITIAAAGVGGAAAAGDLPAPLQNAVASAVSTLTPLSLPHSSTTTQAQTGTSDSTTTSASPTTADDTAATDTAAAATPSLPTQAAFGQSVAAAAQNGGVDGQTISSQARATHQPAQASAAAAHQPAQAAAHRPTQATAPSSSTAAATTSAAPVHGKPATVSPGRP